MADPRVYVHGAGGAGRDAWPGVRHSGALFADFADDDKIPARVRALAELTPPGAVVFAHSAGAVPTALALVGGLISPRALILLEPALYDIARGHPAIEAHISTMTGARGRAAGGDLFGFWALVRPLMFGGPASEGEWPAERNTAAWFAGIEMPWGHSVEASAVTQIPVLVLTGGWNDEYEAIAAVLADHGARTRRLDGAKHRPQDHPDFDATVTEFLRDATGSPRPTD